MKIWAKLSGQGDKVQRSRTCVTCNIQWTGRWERQANQHWGFTFSKRRISLSSVVGLCLGSLYFE